MGSVKKAIKTVLLIGFIGAAVFSAFVVFVLVIRYPHTIEERGSAANIELLTGKAAYALLRQWLPEQAKDIDYYAMPYGSLLEARFKLSGNEFDEWMSRLEWLKSFESPPFLLLLNLYEHNEEFRITKGVQYKYATKESLGYAVYDSENDFVYFQFCSIH